MNRHQIFPSATGAPPATARGSCFFGLSRAPIDFEPPRTQGPDLRAFLRATRDSNQRHVVREAARTAATRRLPSAKASTIAGSAPVGQARLFEPMSDRLGHGPAMRHVPNGHRRSLDQFGAPPACAPRSAASLRTHVRSLSRPIPRRQV